MKSKPFIMFGLILAMCISLIGCGGGGGSSTADSGNPGAGGDGTAYPAKTLRWAPPNAYTDSTPLNPSNELEVFEIYVKTSGSFSANDSPMAALEAVNPDTGQLTTSFNLANLGPYLSRGVTYFVSVRAVAKNSLKSAFSTPASFSF